MNTAVYPASARQRLARLRGSTLIKAFVAGGSVIVAFLICETFVRMIEPQQLVVSPSQLYRPDPVFGWRLKEDLDTVVNTGGGNVYFRTDGRGYRITGKATAQAVADRGGVTRILTIGDSFLEAASLEFEEALPERLRFGLSDHLQQAVSVSSDSAAGWDLNQYYFAARAALNREAYDVGIVFLYVGNDINSGRVDHYEPEQVVSYHTLRVPQSFSKKEVIDALLYPVNDFLEARSHLFVMSKRRLEMPLAKLGLTPMYFPAVFKISEEASDRWDVSTAICRDIYEEFRRRGAGTLFVLIPAPYQVDQAAFARYVEAFNIDVASVDLELPNKLLARRFSEASLRLVDPLPQMRLRHEAGVQLYGVVDRHLNAEGHRVLAETLLPVVKALIGEKY
jgi:hypothetical protein